MSLPPSELPLFPLNTVLFPGSRLPLKVFEARYMDMVRNCMRESSAFGVCLIAEGNEVGAPAVPHDVGTSAHIVEWDMAQLGVLHVAARGEQRFRILHRAAQPDGLIRAVVSWLDESPVTAIPEHFADIVPLLRAVVSDAGVDAMPEPHDFDDANWVGYRYAEILPIPPKAKQKLLELEDPLLRLSILREFLLQRGLLKPAA